MHPSTKNLSVYAYLKVGVRDAATLENTVMHPASAHAPLSSKTLPVSASAKTSAAMLLIHRMSRLRHAGPMMIELQ